MIVWSSEAHAQGLINASRIAVGSSCEEDFLDQLT